MRDENETAEEYLVRHADVLQPTFSLHIPTFSGPIQSLPKAVLGKPRVPFNVSICPTQMPLAQLQGFVDARVGKVPDYNPDLNFDDITEGRYEQVLAFVATHPSDPAEILGWYVFGRRISGDPGDPDRVRERFEWKDPYLNRRSRLDISYTADLENCFLMPEWREQRIGKALAHLVAETIVADLRALVTQAPKSTRIESLLSWEAVSAGGTRLANCTRFWVQYQAKHLRRTLRQRAAGAPRVDLRPPEAFD